MIKRNTFLALSIVLLSSASQATAQPVGQVGQDGSLDSMWIEQPKDTTPAAEPAKAESTEQTEDKPVETPTTSSTTNSASSSTPKSTISPVDTAAPMCTLQAFKNSDIVAKGGWPGVGPFNPDANNDFFDEHHNKLHVDVSGEQITHAQLDLTNRQLSGNADKDLLDMQMNIDFFLEAVGIKPTKIHDLNTELAKNKDALLKADDSPLSLTAGRCAVTIEKRRGVEGNKLDYVIAVSSLDANQQVLREHSLTEQRTPPAAGTVTKQPDPIIIKPPTTISTTRTTTPVTKPPVTATTTTAPTSDSALKDAFTSVISQWQKIKKNATRYKQTEELANVLGGKALVRQTDAIKWLVSNKKYYEMSPKGVTVDQFAVLAPGKKYMVAAQVHEAYKFIDEATGKVQKEVDDINKVNYTIEKIGGKWVITDSALLPMSASSKPKPTR